MTTSSQSDDINIRQASEQDVAQLAQLRFALRSRESDVEAELEFLQRCELWMTKALKLETWRCWVAEKEKRLVGAIWLQLIQKIPNPTPESETLGYITNFFVTEEVRHQGLGSCMLKDVLTWCRAHDVHSVILWPTEKSRSLYERHRFTTPGDLLELSISD